MNRMMSNIMCIHIGKQACAYPNSSMPTGNRSIYSKIKTVNIIEQ